MRLKRQFDIIRALRSEGFARIADLSEQLGVSSNTIRRDLKTLEEKGLLSITYGGAVLNDGVSLGPPLRDRELKLSDEKRRIATVAAKMIQPGDAVLLDAGTTTEQIARQLRDSNNLTVIANAVNVVSALLDNPNLTIICAGGMVNGTTHSFSDFHAVQFLAQFHADIAFISAGGVSSRGVTNTNVAEVPVKQQMIHISKKKVLVVTHEKVGDTSVAPFAQIDDFDFILTDNNVEQESLDALGPCRAEIVVC